MAFLIVASCLVPPGTWPGGAWVPGGPRPILFWLLLAIFRLIDRIFFIYFTCKKGFAQIRYIPYRF